VLTAQQLHTAASLANIANFLQEQKVQIGFGGLIFNLIPSLHTHIAGHFLGERLEETPHLVEDLIRFAPPAPNVPPVAESYRVALSHFRQQQSQIDAHIWHEFQQAEIPYAHFVTATRYMARNIIAALSLGNMDYIGSELDWIKPLLANFQWPSGTLLRFLSVYHEASDLYLNGRGRPIIESLAQVIQNESVRREP
jgi:hypothetical protein